ESAVGPTGQQPLDPIGHAHHPDRMRAEPWGLAPRAGEGDHILLGRERRAHAEARGYYPTGAPRQVHHSDHRAVEVARVGIVLRGHGDPIPAWRPGDGRGPVGLGETPPPAGNPARSAAVSRHGPEVHRPGGGGGEVMVLTDLEGVVVALL